MIMKTCTKCGETKPLASFTKRSDGDKYRSQCKNCLLAYWTAYREAHRGEMAGYKAKWREANASAITESNRNYRDTNRDEVRVRNRTWSRNNPEVSRRACNRRVARRKNAVVDPSASLETVAAVYGWLCYICGVACDATKPRYHEQKAELEHVIPLAKGGSHTFDNLRIACHRCNCIKGARFTAEQVRERLNVAA